MNAEDETPEAREYRLATDAFGREFERRMPPGMGFAMLLFDFSKKGCPTSFTTNVNREDLIRLLDELLEKLRGGGS